MTTEAKVETSIPAARRKRVAAKAACATPDTKEHILEVAERMFADRGFASVSIRDLTAEAGVNIASINYYYGSKDKLLYEVFRRRVTEMTDARISGLRAAEALTGGKPTPRDIFHALIAPAIEWRDPASNKAAALKFLARARTEGTPQIKKVIDARLGALGEFRDALLRAQPGASIADVCWALHFALSTLHHVGVERARLSALSEGACDPSDTAGLVRRLVDYAASGFMEMAGVKAPATAINQR